MRSAPIRARARGRARSPSSGARSPPSHRPRRSGEARPWRRGSDDGAWSWRASLGAGTAIQSPDSVGRGRLAARGGCRADSRAVDWVSRPAGHRRSPTPVDPRIPLNDPSALLSPSLLIDRALVRRNLETMIALARGVDRLRPHVKTHKMAEIVRMAERMGIRKHKCATIAEAEMVALAGGTDVLLVLSARRAQHRAARPAGPRLPRDDLPDARGPS